MKKIQIRDITLKKLAEDRQISLLFRDKTAIAACADSIGADAVELSGIKNLREDTIVYKTIAQNVARAAVVLPVGADAEGVSAAWECIKDAKRPVLQVELPVSTVQMEYNYHMKSDKMIAKIGELVAKAREYCENVEFSALDATRADTSVLIAAVKTAVENGAASVTVCDDAGISLPEEIAELVRTLKAECSVPLFVQVSNKIYMAVSAAISAVTAGAEGIKCAMSGGDALATGALADAVKARSDALGIETSLENTRIHSSIENMLEAINHTAYGTEEAVSERTKILLDSDSTLAQLSQAASLLGYDLTDSDCGAVHKALLQVCEKKDSVGAKELEALIASFAMQAPSTYHLESYNTSSSNLAPSMSQVTLKCGDEILVGVSTGDGPIDSAFRAIEQSIGFHYELDDFQVQAVTEGKEALGSAIVRLRNNGKLYSGNGISTDIVAASIRAYINALNKIVFEEE